MIRTSHGLAAAVLTVGVFAAGCGGSTSVAETTEAPAAPLDSAQLAALVPTPPDSETVGPDAIPDGGIHLHFKTNGAPNATMQAFKTALEGRGWDVTTIVTSGAGEGGGGATFTGTNGASYGVFDGGGYATTTYIDVCAWSAKPDEPNCTRGGR